MKKINLSVLGLIATLTLTGCVEDEGSDTGNSSAPEDVYKPTDVYGATSMKLKLPEGNIIVSTSCVTNSLYDEFGNDIYMSTEEKTLNVAAGEYTYTVKPRYSNSYPTAIIFDENMLPKPADLEVGITYLLDSGNKELLKLDITEFQTLVSESALARISIYDGDLNFIAQLDNESTDVILYTGMYYIMIESTSACKLPHTASATFQLI